MKKCSECGKQMEEKEASTPEGIGYKYFTCSKCGEEIVDMKQLHNVAEQYRTIKLYNAKVTRWGQSLGLRIPKALAIKYQFKANDEVALIPEKNSIKIIPTKK
ncbi:MAG: AbrB/MazE/SpoVT family DNA-binding domain-containing protein [Thermoplasmata archaeon]|nr:AbrB/MazE/SpoVT family DNA-binding domain-containing protein [Thermoplasmata archaeon]